MLVFTDNALSLLITWICIFNAKKVWFEEDATLGQQSGVSCGALTSPGWCSIHCVFVNVKCVKLTDEIRPHNIDGHNLMIVRLINFLVVADRDL